MCNTGYRNHCYNECKNHTYLFLDEATLPHDLAQHKIFNSNSKCSKQSQIVIQNTYRLPLVSIFQRASRGGVYVHRYRARASPSWPRQVSEVHSSRCCCFDGFVFATTFCYELSKPRPIAGSESALPAQREAAAGTKTRIG